MATPVKLDSKFFFESPPNSKGIWQALFMGANICCGVIQDICKLQRKCNRREQNIIGICTAAFVFFLLFYSSTVVAQPNIDDIDQAISILKTCDNPESETVARMTCGFNAIKSIAKTVPPSKECTTSEQLAHSHVVNINQCIIWLKALRKPNNAAEAKKVESVHDTDNAVATPATSTQGLLSVVDLFSKKEQILADQNLTKPTSEEKRINSTDGDLYSFFQDKILFVLVVILILLLIYIGFADIYARSDDLTAKIDELHNRFEIFIKDKDSETLQSKSKFTDGASFAGLRNPHESRVPGAINHSISNASVINHLSSPSGKNQNIQSQSEQRSTNFLNEGIILKAISTLAHNRISLTEANFIGKVSSFYTDTNIKSAIVENLESAQFFSCDGIRTSQGPELLSYRLKGQTNCNVVPFPSAGRVGQYINWFDNATGSYKVDPVLAAIPAIGKVYPDGSLSLIKKGHLV